MEKCLSPFNKNPLIFFQKYGISYNSMSRGVGKNTVGAYCMKKHTLSRQVCMSACHGHIS